MKIIGLTGSIGMGKTTVASMFAKHGVPTISSDEIVHDLYQKDAVGILKEHFPKAIVNGAVDRKELSKYVINDKSAFQKLEQLTHPLVKQKQDEFIQQNQDQGQKLVLIDIPLLFETKSQEKYDEIVVVSCDYNTQKRRVLARPNMNEEKFEAILTKQIPDQKKRALADHIIDTSKSLAETEKQVVKLIKFMQQS